MGGGGEREKVAHLWRGSRHSLPVGDAVMHVRCKAHPVNGVHKRHCDGMERCLSLQGKDHREHGDATIEPRVPRVREVWEDLHLHSA